MESRPFWAVPLRCATETRLSLVPKLIESKAIYKPRVLPILIGGVRAYGGVRKQKSLKSRAVTGPIDSPPFWSVLFWCATETRLRPVPKLIHSKAMYTPWVLHTLSGGLSAYQGTPKSSGVGRLMSLKSRAFTDPLIHGHFGLFVLGANRDKTRT